MTRFLPSLRSPTLVLSLTVLGSARSAAGEPPPVPLTNPGHIKAQLPVGVDALYRAPLRSFYVSLFGNDANPGTSTHPWRTIAKAVATLRPGDAAYIRGGTYYERPMVTAFSGESNAPIHLWAAPGEQVKIMGGVAGKPFLRITQQYWYIRGLEFQGVRGQSAWQPAIYFDGLKTATQRGCQFAVARNIYAHDGGGGECIAFDGAKDVGLYDSTIHSWQRVVNGELADSHGVMVKGNTQRAHIKGNRSYYNSGDSVQCLGTTTVQPQHITIEGNLYYQDRENAVDLKTCRYVSVRNNRFWGYRPASTARGGAALVVHYNAADILIEGNQIRDSGMGASIGATTEGGLLGTVIFRRNAVYNITTAGGGTGVGLYAVRVQAPLEIYNNTFVNIPGAAIHLGAESPAITRAVVINNIIKQAGRALLIYAPNVPDLISDRNLFYQAPLPLNWQATHDQHSVVDQDPLLLADFYTAEGSPARDVGFNVGQGYKGTGPDIGFRESPR